MKAELGFKVKFINENLVGEIICIVSEKKVVVSCSDGFDHEVNLNQLIIIGEDNEYFYSVDEEALTTKIMTTDKTTEQKGFLSKYTNSSKFVNERVLEIDLHLDKLVEFPEKLEDWQRLHTQMQHVKNCLIAANEKNIKKIVFIHGVGTGVLKTELHNYLANIDNLSITEADFREYGKGATAVFVK